MNIPGKNGKSRSNRECAQKKRHKHGKAEKDEFEYFFHPPGHQEGIEDDETTQVEVKPQRYNKAQWKIIDDGIRFPFDKIPENEDSGAAGAETEKGYTYNKRGKVIPVLNGK